MTIRILLDHDIEGYAVFLEAGLQETGWDQYLTIEFLRLRDLGLSDEHSDQEIWRRVQRDRLAGKARPTGPRARRRAGCACRWGGGGKPETRRNPDLGVFFL